MKIFGGHHKTSFRDHFSRVISQYAFLGLFLRSMYRIGILFGISKISNIYIHFFFFGGGGVPDIPDFFLL